MVRLKRRNRRQTATTTPTPPNPRQVFGARLGKIEESILSACELVILGNKRLLRVLEGMQGQIAQTEQKVTDLLVMWEKLDNPQLEFDVSFVPDEDGILPVDNTTSTVTLCASMHPHGQSYGGELPHPAWSKMCTLVAGHLGWHRAEDGSDNPVTWPNDGTSFFPNE